MAENIEPTTIDLWQMPFAEGQAGYVMATDGSGQLIWKNPDRTEQWDFRSSGDMVFSSDYTLFDYIAVPFRLTSVIPRAISGTGFVNIRRNGILLAYANMPIGNMESPTTYASDEPFYVGDTFGFDVIITNGPIVGFVLSTVVNG